MLFFFTEVIFTRKKDIAKEMNPKITTFNQDISTLKGDITSILKVYKDHHSSPIDKKTEANNQTPNNIAAFTRQRIIYFRFLPPQCSTLL